MSKSNENLHFVIQEHHASHLHYDFRLEVNGVLKSWVIPKKPSMDLSIKRLAIQVEDHAFEYRLFEGIISEGFYGAGTVKIWDKGIYYTDKKLSLKQNEEIINKEIAKGHLNFTLEGAILKGNFSLIRFHSQNKNWLLIKQK